MNKHGNDKLQGSLDSVCKDYADVFKIIIDAIGCTFKLVIFLIGILIKVIAYFLSRKNQINIFDFIRNGLNIRGYSSKAGKARLIFSSMVSIYCMIKISNLLDKPWIVLLIIPLAFITSGIIKSLTNVFKSSRLNKNLERCKIEIEIFDMEVSGAAGCYYANTYLPLSEIDKEKVGVALNTTITKITNPKGSRQVVKIEFDNDKTFIYSEIDKKNTIERLEAILMSLKIKNSYISSSENDVETTHTFFTDVAQKRLLRLSKDITHKLALGKKNTMRIEFEAGNTLFTIRKEQTPIYYLDDVLSNTRRPKNMILPFVVGVEASTGKAIVRDLTRMPHMLIGGMTMTGKSVTMNGIVDSLEYWNYDKLICYITDFKEATLTKYKQLGNCQYVGDSEEEQLKLYDILYIEYNKRKKLFSEASDNLGVECRDIHQYNKLYPNSQLPYIVVITEEINTMLQVFSKETLAKSKDKIGLINIRTFFFTKGRSLGIHFIDSVQKATDGEYSNKWRASIEVRIAHKMSEEKEIDYVLQHSKEMNTIGVNQPRGEFLFKDEKSEILKLKGCFIDEDNNKIFKSLQETSRGRNPRKSIIQDSDVPNKTAI